MLFRDCAIQWVYVTENEVQFDVVATLVWSEHNRVRCFIMELSIGYNF